MNIYIFINFLKMFESTGWNICEPKNNSLCEKYDLKVMTVLKPLKAENETKTKISEIGIVQQYQFFNSLQRMSVIIQIPDTKEFRGYTKGSPEMILSLSRPETIPPGTTATLEKYTQQGYRVIALASSDINKNPTEVSFKNKLSKFYYVTILHPVTFL